MNAYFSALAKALDQQGIGWPVLVIDEARLNANISHLKQALPKGMGWRIVAKSLPSQGLIEYVARAGNTNRLMVFNLHFLEILTEQKGWDILLGKPLPVAALAHFLKNATKQQRENLTHIQWLVDTPSRIHQYQELAQAHDVALRLNLELDVGLGRGGFRVGEEVAAALGDVKQSNHCVFSGFMGYEPHLPMLPEDKQAGAFAEVQRRYKEALDVAAAQDYPPDAITRNAGGSPTYRLYRDLATANEIAAGSVLVKPSHFDTPLLSGHVPACFIATPALKTLSAGERLRVFFYGGKWMADPHWPEGMTYDELYGRSSNQESVLVSPEAGIRPDDWLFFRPHQSEAVLLQFGDIAVYNAGKITKFWPTFPAAP